MNDQDMIIYKYVGVQKFCLTTKQDGIVNCRTEYFSSKISSQKRSSGKQLNMYPFVHTKKLVHYTFYRNFVPFGCSESIGCLYFGNYADGANWTTECLVGYSVTTSRYEISKMSLRLVPPHIITIYDG